MNCSYYIANSTGLGVAFDGFTSGLQGLVSVVPGQTYHFKITIADVDDALFDSSVMFLAHSFKSLTATGITEQEKKNNLSVYPNPLYGSFLSIDSKEVISSVELYSCTGQSIELPPLDRTSNSVLLNNIPAGVYFLHVITESGKNVRKIVIE